MATARQVRIVNDMGLHVRPATELSRVARQFASTVCLIKNGQRADAKSCLDLLTLAAAQGTELVVEADGPDAPAAVDAVAGLIQSGFGEE